MLAPINRSFPAFWGSWPQGCFIGLAPNRVSRIDTLREKIGGDVRFSGYQLAWAEDFSAGTFWGPSFCGRGMSGLTPAPTKRVHDPSGVATHGVALWSAGQSRFRSARVVIAPAWDRRMDGRDRGAVAGAARLRPAAPLSGLRSKSREIRPWPPAGVPATAKIRDGECEITISRFAPFGCQHAIRRVHAVASRILHGQFPVTRVSRIKFAPAYARRSEPLSAGPEICRPKQKPERRRP
jgi:hypothetical protein